MKAFIHCHCRARRDSSRRAFSLLELTAVVAILGLLATAGFLRFGEAAVNTTETEGFVRRLTLDLRQARRATIATGDDHYVQLNRASGNVTGYDLIRVTSGGDAAVQPTTPLPSGATVTTGTDTWQFDFTGALSSGVSGVIQVDGARFAWVVNVNAATGRVGTTSTPQP